MYRIFYLLQGHGGWLAAAIGIAGLGFSIWMAYDCWRRNGEAYWIYLILFTGGLFALIYFFTQYWTGSRMEYGIWRWFVAGGRVRELERRAKQLKTAPCYETLGHAQYDLRRYEKAEEAYRKALELAPDSFEAQAGLGCALLSLKRVDEAWPLLGKAYQRKPDYENYRLLWMVARCQAQRKNFDDARNLYEFFLRQHGYSEARIEYAEVLADSGDLAAGKAALEELISEIEVSPLYSRRRERPWSRAARKLLRRWEQLAA